MNILTISCIYLSEGKSIRIMSDAGSDSGARPKSGSEGLSLGEAMERGREARIRMEQLEKQTAERKTAAGEDDTDEEEYNMMIAGLSEVVSSNLYMFFKFVCLCL